jgi:hypothetical protein
MFPGCGGGEVSNQRGIGKGLLLFLLRLYPEPLAFPK